MSRIKTLNLEYIKSKNQVSIKTFIMSSLMLLCAVLLYIPFGLSLPTPGRIICFITFILYPALIIGWHTKDKVLFLKRRSCLSADSIKICELKVCNKDISYDNDNTAWHSLEFSSLASKQTELPKYFETVSAKEFNKVSIGSLYYAVFSKETTAHGVRYLNAGLYYSGDYVLAEDLRPFLVCYEEIAATNQVFNEHLRKNGIIDIYKK